MENKGALINRRKRIPLLGWVLIFLILLYTFSPKPLFYRAPAETLYVLDSETRKPVSGAIIVAMWKISGGSFHSHPTGSIKTERIITSSDGSFRLSGFSFYWRSWIPLFFRNYLTPDQPTIFVLKAGYKPTKFLNERAPETGIGRHILTLIQWRAGPLYLDSLKGSEAEIYKQFKESHVPLQIFIPSVASCNDFEEFKSALLEVDKQELRAEKSGVVKYKRGSWIDPLEEGAHITGAGMCTAIMEWLEKQRQIRKDFYERF